MACDPSKCKMCQSIVDWKLGKRAARIKSGGHDAGCPMLGLGARDKQADWLREKLIADYVTTINNDDATVGAAAEEQPQQPPPPPPPPPPPQPPPPSQPSRRAEQRAEAGRAQQVRVCLRSHATADMIRATRREDASDVELHRPCLLHVTISTRDRPLSTSGLSTTRN